MQRQPEYFGWRSCICCSVIPAFLYQITNQVKQPQAGRASVYHLSPFLVCSKQFKDV